MVIRREVDAETAPRIDQQAARDLFERGAATFVDVRKRDSYDASHIPGALSIPLGEILTRLDEIPSSGPIITYCA